MDTSNMTAAGPAYGLIDVIFGSAPKEEAADGKGFSPLMDLVKAMKEKAQPEAMISRTDEETGAGKDGKEFPVVGMPAFFLSQAQMQAIAPPAEGGDSPAVAMPKVDAQQVNRLLQEKSLPPLGQAEMALLERVNGKIELANLQGEVPLAAAPSDGPAQDLPMTGDASEDPFTRELARRGVDPKLVKEATASGTAGPEKFLSTEAYLQMHDRFGAKPETNTTTGARRMGEEDGANAAPALPQNERAQMVSAETGRGKDGGLGGGDRALGDQALPELRDRKIGQPVFSGHLGQAIRREDVPVKDILLPTGATPEMSRDTLLGEVSQGVSFTAVKGGGEMRLVIYPEALGEVKLKVGTSGGKVEVQVTAENEDVAKVIRGGSRELESSLRDQSLTLAKFDVSVADPVAGIDTKTSLTDQFLPKDQGNQPQNFGHQQGEQRSARWDGGQQQHGQPGRGGLNLQSNETVRSTPSRGPIFPKQTARSNAGRLDVVA